MMKINQKESSNGFVFLLRYFLLFLFEGVRRIFCWERCTYSI